MKPTVIFVVALTLIIASFSLIYDWLLRFILGVKTYDEQDIRGKTVIVTGANRGIGKQTAFTLAKKGATVVMACRNLSKGKKAQNQISQAGSGKVDLLQLDLADLASVRKFSDVVIKKYPKIDILINNAGFCDLVNKLPKTKNGFDMHIGVNHLGHFLLTHLLLDKIKEATNGRIVVVSSSTCMLGRINMADLMFDKSGSTGLFNLLPYFNSKLANSLFAKQLSRKLRGTEVSTYSCCPGITLSNFYQNIPFCLKPLVSVFGVHIEIAAEVVVYCAIAKEVAHSTGLFYRRCSPNALYNRFLEKNEDLGLKLWDECEKLVGLKER